MGEQHLDTATSLGNLAVLYQSRGRYEEAEPLSKQALKIRQIALGEQHPDTAQSLNSLGELYFNQGRKEATLLFEQALVILANVLGKGHPETQAVFSHYIVSLSNREG